MSEKLTFENATFSDLSLNQSIVDALAKKGYTKPTQIQFETITRFNNWAHIVWQSQTGTGKTAAFVIPLINSIDPAKKWIQAIVMCPTRELVVQTEEEFYKLSYWTLWFKTWVAYGWGWTRRQIEKIQQGCQVLIATPGRLIDLIERWVVKTDDINYFVLDEADRMLDMWFVEDIEYIVSKCDKIKQFLSFSATITSELNRVLTQFVGQEFDFIKIAAQSVVVDKIDHSFTHVTSIAKLQLLDKVVEDHKGQKIIIFTQTKMSADDVVRNLRHMKHEAVAIHWDIDQRDRMRIVKNFKADYVMILVATDVAARGLNLNDVDLVINFEVPQDPESYVHRIGRTWRAGKSWKAMMFVDHKEMRSVEIIEKRNKLKIKQIDQDWNEVERQAPRWGSWGSRWRFGWGGSRWGYSSGGSRWGYNSGGSRWGYNRDWWTSSAPRTEWSYTPRAEWPYAPRTDSWAPRWNYNSAPRSDSGSSSRWSDRPRTGSYFESKDAWRPTTSAAPRWEAGRGWYSRNFDDQYKARAQGQQGWNRDWGSRGWFRKPR